MLKHDETQDLPAASQRVTAEELSRAVSALDEARAAEQINGTAPIGQVVEELNLDATPEEIWAQVQRQRAEGAAKTSAKKSIITPAARRRVSRLPLAAGYHACRSPPGMGPARGQGIGPAVFLV